MGLRFPNQKCEHCFFVTTTFLNHAAYGRCPGMYQSLANSLRHYSVRRGAQVAAYVLMPTHLHMLLFIDGSKLCGFMRDLKKFVAQKQAPDLGITEEHLWMPRYDRVAIVSERQFRIKMEYIHRNPVKAGLCEKQEDWEWSSAGDYLGGRKGRVIVWKGWG